MAFGGTVTSRGHGQINYSGTTGDVGDTFTPAEDDIILVIVANSSSTGSVTSMTASNWNITFSEVTGSPWGGQAKRLGLWVGRVGASPTSDRVTANRSGMITRSGFYIVQISGCKTDGTPESVLEQISSLYEAYQGGGSPITIDTLSSFQTDSLTFCFGLYGKGGATWTTPSGYTGFIDDDTYSLSVIAVYNTAEDTTPNLEYSSLPTYEYVDAIALEIRSDSGGAGSVVPIIMSNLNQFNGGIIK